MAWIRSRWKALRLDLETLGLRDRRGHDLRRTFVSLLQVDGAQRDRIRPVSHGMPGDVMSSYTTFTWAGVCSEVAKLKIELREGEIVPFPTEKTAASHYTAVTGGFISLGSGPEAEPCPRRCYCVSCCYPR